jgi:dolichol-phosphate mannosyltransferase
VFFLSKRLLGWEVASLGFTTLTCCVLGLGGCQLVAIGILGEYLGRIYEEVKRRPLYFLADPEAQRPAIRNGDVPHRRSAA